MPTSCQIPIFFQIISTNQQVYINSPVSVSTYKIHSTYLFQYVLNILVVRCMCSRLAQHKYIYIYSLQMLLCSCMNIQRGINVPMMTIHITCYIHIKTGSSFGFISWFQSCQKVLSLLNKYLSNSNSSNPIRYCLSTFSLVLLTFVDQPLSQTKNGAMCLINGHFCTLATSYIYTPFEKFSQLWFSEFGHPGTSYTNHILC